MASHSVLFLFLLIGKLSLHNSSKYLVSTSVQLEPWFLFVAPGCGFSSFLTRELRACSRASYRYDVGNSIRSLARSLDRSIPVNFFLDFRLLSAFDSFWRAINRRNGDLCC